MNFLFIKVMRRIATAQYAAEYDMFETVLFLETMATTFCRLRPEALHRHACHSNFDCFQQQWSFLML
jgi:hypothetical protein